MHLYHRHVRVTAITREDDGRPFVGASELHRRVFNFFTAALGASFLHNAFGLDAVSLHSLYVRLQLLPEERGKVGRFRLRQDRLRARVWVIQHVSVAGSAFGAAQAYLCSMRHSIRTLGNFSPCLWWQGAGFRSLCRTLESQLQPWSSLRVSRCANELVNSTGDKMRSKKFGLGVRRAKLKARPGPWSGKTDKARHQYVTSEHSLTGQEPSFMTHFALTSR